MPWWIRHIGALVAGKKISVVVGEQGRFLYLHGATRPRRPASNEKLLLSMALFDALGADFTVTTTVKAEAAPVDGVIDGNVWLVGHADPEVGRTTVAELAKQIAGAGVTKIRGHVMGSTDGFARERWAVGWKAHYTLDEVPFPTALTFLGNVGPGGAHIVDPERRAAAALTRQLEKRGVRVTRAPGMGSPPSALVPVASATSATLGDIVHRMDVDSINFDAEELAQLLGSHVFGPPGTFDKGARAITAFEEAHGVDGFVHHDGSGLSYRDRVTARGIVDLLWVADAAAWGTTLRGALPHAGQGTLVGRLHGVRVRAKTGTLNRVSALSGWVWLQEPGAWAEFSILDRGMTKDTAVRLEDAIVRTVSAHAH